MRCPVCNGESNVYDSRTQLDGSQRRRHRCRDCLGTWKTTEIVIEDSFRQAKAEPEWWSEARALKRQGLGETEIGRRLGRSRYSVRYALRPSVRMKKRETQIRYISDPKVRRALAIKAQLRMA